MSELLTFLRLGVGHITTLAAADHILFLIALAAIYRLADWREALWTVSAFTVGHSISLALAVTQLITLPGALIEFLIPVTIIVTCAENIIAARRERRLRHWYRPVLAGVFGLVHGAGFANYLRELFVENIGVPLLGFNIGIEIGQLMVLVAIGVAFVAIDRLVASMPVAYRPSSVLRARAITISAGVALVATGWAAQRLPW